ncbi:MAG: hypothetical protein Q8K30_04520 [Candidatus Gracilibacteria bacterium]|nr:hypothetical protein [Candidatus Gracilibacteria bacterium]
MGKIVNFNEHLNTKKEKNITNSVLNDFSIDGLNKNVLFLIDNTKNKINDIYLLGTPDKNDLNKFKELKNRVGIINGYEYLNDFILNTAKKNYDLNPDILPFFININIEKCSSSELNEIITLINNEIKRIKIPINTKQFLFKIRNLCIQKNKETIS